MFESTALQIMMNGEILEYTLAAGIADRRAQRTDGQIASLWNEENAELMRNFDATRPVGPDAGDGSEQRGLPAS